MELDIRDFFEAVRSRDVERVARLLEEGHVVDCRDKEKKTPLHYAARTTRNVEIVELLVKMGANINAQDQYGHTPWDVAWCRLMEDAIKRLGGKTKDEVNAST